MTSIEELRAADVNNYADGESVWVSGYYSPNDGGGGIYIYDADSSASDDGGSVIAPNSGIGRFVATFCGAINVKRFGAVGDNITDDTVAIIAALAYIKNSGGGVLYTPKGIYVISAGLTITQSYTIIRGDGNRNTAIRPVNSMTSGSVITLGVGSVVKECKIIDLQIVTNLEAADNTMIGLNLALAQHSVIDRVEVFRLNKAVRVDYDTNAFRDCVVWYAGTGYEVTSGGNAINISGGKIENCTTGASFVGCTSIRVIGTVIQSNTTGMSIGAAAVDVSIDAYFENNTLAASINGGSVNTKADGVRISGYINHSTQAPPVITLAYCSNVDISNVVLRGITTTDDAPFSIGEGVDFLKLGCVTDDERLVVSPQAVPVSGIISTQNLIHNGSFDMWALGATVPSGWSIVDSTATQVTSDDRDGENVVELTSAGAGGGLYMDIPIPPALVGLGINAIMTADVKHVSGTSLRLACEPLDGSNVVSGTSRTRTSVASSWTTLAIRPVIIGPNAVKLRVILVPDTGTGLGVARFSRVALYFGNTPFGFSRNPQPRRGYTTWDPGSLADGAQTTKTLTVTGATVGCPVAVGLSVDLAGLTISGYVSTANTVTAVLRNNTGAPVDLAESTLTAYVFVP